MKMKASSCTVTEVEARGEYAINLERISSLIEGKMQKLLGCLVQVDIQIEQIGKTIDDAFPPCDEETQCYSVYKDIRNIFLREKSKIIDSVKEVNRTVDAMICPVIETMEDHHYKMMED
jgi:hypothetical protein